MLLGMMDQMASVGVEFDAPSLQRVFQQSVEFYQSAHDPSRKGSAKLVPWAVSPIYDNNKPIRPWGLGEICKQPSLLYRLSGTTTRTPGMYKQVDPKTQRESSTFLKDTNERVHSSVRVRLACGGLDLNDAAVWKCPSLGNWRLAKTTKKYDDPVPRHPSWEPEGNETAFIEHPDDSAAGRWVWEYVGDASKGNPNEKQRVMIEEPLGPYERYLLKFSGGTPNVYLFANDKDNGAEN